MDDLFYLHFLEDIKILICAVYLAKSIRSVKHILSQQKKCNRQYQNPTTQFYWLYLLRLKM